MKILKIVLFLSFLSVYLFAQNLVPNPSFEIFSSCPDNYNQVSKATGWFPSSNNNNPAYHTEYCNQCGTSNFAVPTNTWGNQPATNGVGYMAEATMSPSIQQDYRENIYAQLTSALIVGKAYFVSMKVSHTDNSQYASNNFGAKFSTVPNFPVNNLCQVYSSSIITDKINWITISGCFIADSAYKYICLGNFFTDANTLTQQSCPGCQWPLYGYFVDDVSVTLMSPSISGNTFICAGENSTLTASGGTSYVWNTGATVSSIIVAPTSTSSYSVNIIDGICNANVSITVTVSPSITVSISGNTTICSGQSSTLTASGGTNYSWNTGATTASIIISPTTNTTYSVTAFAGSCTNTTSTMVSILPSPSILISANSSICYGNSTTLTVSGGNQYLWSTGETSSSIVVSPITNTTYSATLTDNNGCSTIGTTIVSVTNTIATISGVSTICNGNSSMLSASGGTSYLWNTGATTDTIIVTPNVTTSYSIVVSNGNCTDTAAIEVTVNPVPVVVALGNTAICQGDSATLQCTGTASIYSWAPTTGISPTIGTPISAFPQNSTTYTVTGADGNGCINQATVTITVNPVPTPSIAVSGSTTICLGDMATMIASGGTYYVWSNGDTSTTITIAPSTTTTYSVVASNGTCSGSVTAFITVSPPPIAVVSNATICSGQNAILTASGGGNYSWNTGNTNSSINVSPSSSTTYFVVVSLGTCSDTAKSFVVVNPSPIVIAGNNVTISTGSNATLFASGGNYYLWNTGETTNTLLVSPTVTTLYTVITSEANGCTAMDSVIVFVLEVDCDNFQQLLFIPNVFSPNGDEENDALTLFYNLPTSCIKIFEFTIYNRWGEEVFQTNLISDSWDGTYNGQRINSGVFFYYCKVTSVTNKQIIKKGNITVLR